MVACDNLHVFSALVAIRDNERNVVPGTTGTFTFTVNSVNKTEFVYDAALNTMISNSVTIQSLFSKLSITVVALLSSVLLSKNMRIRP